MINCASGFAPWWPVLCLLKPDPQSKKYRAERPHFLFSFGVRVSIHTLPKLRQIPVIFQLMLGIYLSLSLSLSLSVYIYICVFIILFLCGGGGGGVPPKSRRWAATAAQRRLWDDFCWILVSFWGARRGTLGVVSAHFFLKRAFFNIFE